MPDEPIDCVTVSSPLKCLSSPPFTPILIEFHVHLTQDNRNISNGFEPSNVEPAQSFVGDHDMTFMLGG